MTSFWKIRIGTLIWGFSMSLMFTGELVVALPMFTAIVLGNTMIMYKFSK